MIKITKGLDVPIAGAPLLDIDQHHSRYLALVGADYIGLRPSMRVQVGDRVAKGQVLFEDKQNPGLLFTAPAAGVVQAIHRGAQRVFQSLVIQCEGSDEVQWASFAAADLAQLGREIIVKQLVESGLWTAFRTRPFSKVPLISSEPAAIFVNAMDTNPLAFDPQVVINERSGEFVAGLTALSRLAAKVYVAHAADAQLPPCSVASVQYQAFTGVHPAGLPGTHIHYLAPVGSKRTVWTLNYQDVVAIGHLFTQGKLDAARVIALAGPSVKQPRLIKTVLGADLRELTQGQLLEGEHRVVSGSVLSGRAAVDAVAYLGRYHLQVSVLREGRERDFLGWLSPGVNRFSALNIYVSKWMRGKKFAFTTNTNGSPRAIVPIGVYEQVMPLDILPTHLLRALVVGDVDTAVKLGALELDEEDLALCSYVCPGKYEFGAILRDNLTLIEKEG